MESSNFEDRLAAGCCPLTSMCQTCAGASDKCVHLTLDHGTYHVTWAGRCFTGHLTVHDINTLLI